MTSRQQFADAAVAKLGLLPRCTQDSREPRRTVAHGMTPDLHWDARRCLLRVPYKTAVPNSELAIHKRT